MSILDDYDSLGQKNDKELILRSFNDITPYQAPAAYKAWFDVMSEYLVKDITIENKCTIIYLFEQCNIDYHIYSRNFGYECPIVTVVERWRDGQRIRSIVQMWVREIIKVYKCTLKDIERWMCTLIGIDHEEIYTTLKGNKWVNSYYVYSIDEGGSFNPTLGYQNKPIQSNYYKYKQYIYQLLELYKIKKES